MVNDLIQIIRKESNYERNVVFSNLPLTEEQGMTIDDSVLPGRIEFLDFLCYLPNPSNYFERFVSFLEKFYEKNQSQLKKVEDFAKNYRAENAIQWYTKDTFIYRLLNAALRRYNIQVLFLFSFLIKDIQNQLKKEHEAFISNKHSIVKVYRGQMMSPEEIEQLKNNNNTPWFTNNSFLSTTLNRDVALRFLNQSASITGSELQSVLFEIEVNTQMKSRPYGDISHLSQFEDEKEFLFTFGNRFEKIFVFYNDLEYIYTVQLQLNYDYYMKEDGEFISNNQRKMFKKCVTLLEAVTEEISMEYIHTIYEELIHLYPSEEGWVLALKMNWLAMKYMKEKNYIAALDYYKQALCIWHKFTDDEELKCYFDIARIHRNLAGHHQYDIIDQVLAEKEYLEAAHYFKLALKTTETYFERMKIYEKLIYLENHRMQLEGYDRNDTEMIVRYEELCIANMLQHYHDDKLQLGHALKQLGSLRKFQFQYDECLIIYKRALDIFLQQPYEFGLYLNICYIINEMITIYIEEKKIRIIYQLLNMN